jgi:hypothetical protein
VDEGGSAFQNPMVSMGKDGQEDNDSED